MVDEKKITHYKSVKIIQTIDHVLTRNFVSIDKDILQKNVTLGRKNYCLQKERCRYKHPAIHFLGQGHQRKPNNPSLQPPVWTTTTQNKPTTDKSKTSREPDLPIKPNSPKTTSEPPNTDPTTHVAVVHISNKFNNNSYNKQGFLSHGCLTPRGCSLKIKR